MSKNIQILKSFEVSDSLWTEIARGYKICFDLEISIDELKDLFSKTILGFSLHALKFSEDGKVIGHNYLQPIPYRLGMQNIVCALSGGTFVLPDFRKDIMIFHDLLTALNRTAADLGWKALLGVPNENSFKYTVKINRQKHIGDLSYYLLPLKVGKVLKKNSPILNGISSIYSSLNILVNGLVTQFYNSKEKDKLLHLDLTDKFKSSRLERDCYKHLKSDSYTGTYRICDEGGILTAYIIDFKENNKRTAKSLYKILKYIRKNEKVDAIMYVGTLNFPQLMLTKVPKKFEPQQMPLCVTIYDKENMTLKEALSSIKNVDFGLINFDVR